MAMHGGSGTARNVEDVDASPASTGGGELRVFYGGTFDPVHDGHLAIARAARDLLDCEVLLMPAADPPHRPAPGADAMHRAHMLALAVAGEPRLGVDLRELQRDGRSYTVDTLRGMRGEFGNDAPIALLIGADSLLGLPGWHQWQALFGLAHLVIADRPGSPLDSALPAGLAAAIDGRWVDAPQALRDAPSGALFRLRQPLHPGSATEIRRRIAAGGGWEELVPTPVAGHIRRHGLYGVHGAPAAPSL